jgi:hypothetical protein
LARPNDDVDASPGKPAALVEPGVRAARGNQLRMQLEDRTLRWRPPGWQLEQDSFPEDGVRESSDLCRDASLVGSTTRGTGDHDSGIAVFSDAREQRALFQRVETEASPPEARASEHHCERRDSRDIGLRKKGSADRHSTHEQGQGRRRAQPVGEREPDARREHQCSRPAELERTPDHGVT